MTPTFIETIIYALASVIVISVLASIYVLASTKPATRRGDGLTPTVERRYREAGE